MYQPLRAKTKDRNKVSKPFRLPAPTKGWYVGANLADAPVGTAYALVNAFPQLDYVRFRKGSLTWASGLGATVSTLMTFTDGVHDKFFAAAGGRIYDVTSAGAVGAALVSGLGSSSLEYVQFVNAGATWLIAVNGVDAPRLYSYAGGWGTTPAITGLTGNPLAHVNVFKNRLYFVENNSLNVWYLGVNSIGGAATVFPMQGVFRFGGSLLATATWAIDSTSGIYESFIAISTEGEVLMYDGADPSSWTLKGSYKISKPLGRRCTLRAGGDLLIMTEDGIVPMSKVMTLDQIALQNVAITQPIQPAWREAVLARAGLSGWQIVLWPTESMGVVTLPKKDIGDETQFVVNARTGAWSKFEGWDANCFAVFDQNLFFGDSNGNVVQAETGAADNGSNYTVTIFPSFTDTGNGALRKHVHMVRPFITANFTNPPQISVKVDFNTSFPLEPTAIVPSLNGAKWGTGVWGVDVWPTEAFIQNSWHYAPGMGSYFSPVLQMTLSSSTFTPDVRLTAIDVIFEEGNFL